MSATPLDPCGPEYDAWLELFIDQVTLVLGSARGAELRRDAAAAQRFLVGLRRPERVAAMERERGLVG